MPERKATKFYRSYYEVAKELPDKYQGVFVMAILKYQFEGLEPEFKGMLKLAWISQKHSLDKQIEGFKHGDKGGRPLKGTLNPPLKGTSNQEQEKEQEQVKEKEERNIIPPTLEMVNSYKSLTRSKVDTSIFIDFYTSKNWMVGKTKMKDWQAAFRRWSKSENNSKPQKSIF